MCGGWSLQSGRHNPHRTGRREEICRETERETSYREGEEGDLQKGREGERKKERHTSYREGRELKPQHLRHPAGQATVLHAF